MSSNIVAPLKHKSIQELKAKYGLHLKGQDPRNLLKKIDKIYEKAQEALKLGEQEDGYVYLMKYLNVLCFIQSCVDYKNDSTYYKAMLGGIPVKAIALAEKLHQELDERYAALNSQSQVEENNLKNLSMKGSDILIQPSPDMRVKKENKSGVISSVRLFNMLKDGSNGKVLIIDCRPKADFSASQIKEKNVINIEDEIISLGMSANVLEQRLSMDVKALWAERGSFDNIILLDWNTRESNNGVLDTNSKVWILKNILTKWDVNTDYKCDEILILAGGYHEWLQAYPWYTTNANVHRPQDDEPVSLYDDLDKIVYPDLESLNESVKHELLKPFFDRSTKPSVEPGHQPRREDLIEELQQPSSRTSLPVVDRAEKRAAMKTYEERKADMEQLLKQTVIETSQALELEKTMMDSERELQENIQEQVLQVDDEKRRKLEEEEEELLLKVEELKEESFEKDNKIKELQRIIEVYEKRDAEELMVKERDKERLIKEAEMNQEIQRKEEEKARLVKERQEMEKENAERYKEKLAAARKNKKNVDSRMNKENERVIPQINRSSKPRYVEPPAKVRQFSGTKGNVGPGLTGLKNLGNSCYMNSILQCISNNWALAKYFCDDHYRGDVNKSNKTRGEIAEEVAALVKTLWSGHFRSVACRDLKCTVGTLKPEYGLCEQQDSHEFLTFLMDWLHNDLNKVYLSGRSEKDKPLSETEKAWLNFKNKNESLISTLFYGLQKSTVRCLRCNEESATYEPFSNLSLIIPDGENHTLMQCLNLYLKTERISGWRCPRCKELRDAEKKTDVCKLPPILVIHLKRFHYIDVTSKKRTTYVDFPLTDLNVSQFIVEGKQKNTMYDLYGVSNHYGTMEGGHYTAYCKSALFKNWYKFDDHEVVEISPAEVKTNAAYILFYTSMSPFVPNSCLKRNLNEFEYYFKNGKRKIVRCYLRKKKKVHFNLSQDN